MLQKSPLLAQSSHLMKKHLKEKASVFSIAAFTLRFVCRVVLNSCVIALMLFPPR